MNTRMQSQGQLSGRPRKPLWVLTAVLVFITSGACCEGDANEGITDFRIDATGTIFTIPVAYTSRNGGLTWKESAEVRELPQPETQSSHMVETPRGAYAITDAGIHHIENDELVYSTLHLQQDSSQWAQRHLASEVSCESPTTKPYGIIFDEISGNLIVAMGILGVVIGRPDGSWIEAGVGPYSPVDISFIRKLKLLSASGFWISSLALALAFNGVAVALAASFREDILRIFPVRPGYAVVFSFIFLLVIIAISFVFAFGIVVVEGIFITRTLVWAVLPLTAILVVALPLLTPRELRLGAVRRSVALTFGILTVASFIVSIASQWTKGQETVGIYLNSGLVQFLIITSGLLFAVPTLVLSQPMGRQLKIVMASIGVTYVLLASVYLLWLGDFLIVSDVGVWSLFLPIAVAFALYIYLLRSPCET